MPGAKPTLGYPSQTAAVMALLQKGLTPAEVAARIKLTADRVRALQFGASSRERSRARRDGGDAPPPVPIRPRHGRPKREIVLNNEVIRALRPHAARRELTPHSLAVLLVEAVVEHGLIDAVLDDGGDAS